MPQLLSPEIAERTDEEIERDIRENVVRGAFLWCSPGYVDLDVHHGVVTLRGEVESSEVVALLAAGAARVTGVVSVQSELRVAGTP